MSGHFERLEDIQCRYVEWHQDRGDHTPAPEDWRDADPGESMEHCIVRNDVPALVSALRAVLSVCGESTLQARPHGGGEPYMIVSVEKIHASIEAALGQVAS